MSHKTNHSLSESDIFSHFKTMQYMPRWMVLLIDLALCLIAFVTATYIGKGIFNYRPSELILESWQQAIIILVLQTISFWAFHTYSGILRYSTFIDTIKVLLSVLTTGLVAMLVNGACLLIPSIGHKIYTNSICILYVFVAFTFLFSLRVGVKTLFEAIQQNASTTKKVLIYGTKQAGIAIAKMLRSSGESLYRPVGFIEDDNSKRIYNLIGLKVYRLDDTLIEKMKQHGIRNVIISPLKMKELRPSKDLKIFLENNIHVLTTPYFTEWDNNDNQTTATRIGRIDSIQIEDLLERPTININTDNVKGTLSNQVVLISGAAGSIGSELARQVASFKPKAIILFEQAESPLHDLTLDLRQQYPNQRLIPCIGDIRDRERVNEVIGNLRPDIIFHAAAYKHVPLMEDHPNEAIHANVLGTKNMADMAVKYKVERFIMISTDKAVNPTNIMGASKRIAEMYVQSLFRKLNAKDENCTKFITTRFGNVLGSNGSVIPYFKKQIAQGGPVTVTHPEIIRYFMTIPEACCLVLEAATLGKGGEIFVFDMGQPVKILDLAKNMIRLAGYTPGKDMQITFTGLRPGEKLYEELLNQKETTLPTINDKIMVARVREVDFDEVSQMIDELIDISHGDQIFRTVSQMKKIVPEFISKNSIYEKLDR